MRYDIRYYGDPVLREQATPVPEVTGEIRDLARDMLETMRAERGVGLAAQQIGKTVALCVVSIPEDYDVDPDGERLNPEVAMPLVLLNPEIVEWFEPVERGEEGCLSFPEITGPIPRAQAIHLRFMDLEGQARDLALRGFLARAVQHEIDHLNGVLFIDHMSQVKRVAIAGKLRRMRRETERTLSA